MFLDGFVHHIVGCLESAHVSEDSISHIDTTWIELNFLRGFELDQHFSILFRKSS